MTEIKSYPVDSDKLKNNVLFCALQKFYNQCPTEDKQMFLDIINGKYDYMLDQKRIDTFAETIKSEYSYDKGYQKLLQIFNISR